MGFCLYAVPGSGPPNVNAEAVGYDKIKVAWGELPCVEHNGLITGYVIKASLNEEIVNTISVGNSTTGTLTGLLPLRMYTVSVAAVNSLGTGPYSDPVVLTTPLTSMQYDRDVFTV